MSFVYEAHGHTHRVVLTPLEGQWVRCEVDGVEMTLEAQALGEGRWLLRYQGQQTLVHTASVEKGVALHLDGQHYRLNRVDERAPRRVGAPVQGNLTAPMPGQITQMNVAVQESVQAGHVLLVMEAMKMEIRISSPYEGRVSALHVRQGDLVQRGQTLIEISEEKI